MHWRALIRVSESVGTWEPGSEAQKHWARHKFGKMKAKYFLRHKRLFLRHKCLFLRHKCLFLRHKCLFLRHKCLFFRPISFFLWGTSAYFWGTNAFLSRNIIHAHFCHKISIFMFSRHILSKNLGSEAVSQVPTPCDILYVCSNLCRLAVLHVREQREGCGHRQLYFVMKAGGAQQINIVFLLTLYSRYDQVQEI